MMYDLTQKDKDILCEKMKLSVLAIRECDDNIAEQAAKGYGFIDVFNPKGFVQCSCSSGHNIKQEGYLTCQFCSTTTIPLLSPQKREELNNRRRNMERSHSAGYPDTTHKVTNFFYVKGMPDSENGIIIYSLNLKISFDSNDELDFKWKINGVVEIVPGQYCKGYKIVRGKESPVDAFTVLNINSSYFKAAPVIYFENAYNSVDFVLKHKLFNKYTAYMDLFNVIDVNIPKESFFMMYMYLYAEYPSVELIIKMQMYGFCRHMMQKMIQAPDRIAIKEMVDSFTKLLNSDATTGNHVFNLPKYVIEDCLLRETSWEEMLAWQDIFELDVEKTIGKDMYYQTTRHYLYGRNHNMYQHILHGAIYGYTPWEFINYVAKQHEKLGQPISYRKTYVSNNISQCFVDYLRMCDTMNVTPDKYPQDIIAAHDNLAASISAQENAVVDAMISRLSKAAEKHLPKNDEYVNSEYFIQLPQSSWDIIQEGQNMRNCVGSYLQRIADRESFVFFIRRKDKPHDSFITAEYKSAHITQLFYKNNRTVTDGKLKQMANSFAANLRKSQFEIAHL